jgi:hypothetical protein
LIANPKPAPRIRRPRRRIASRPKRTTLKRKADALWSELVRRRGACEAAGIAGVQCGGVLQAAHGFPRTYYPTRWTPLNGFCICAGHHRWYTSHPIDWLEFMHVRLGEFPLEELKRLARTHSGKVDYLVVIAELKEKLRTKDGG